MARFGSTAAFTVPTSLGGTHKKYRAGTTYADTVGNAIAGDVVWYGMSSSTMSPGLIPLDGAATTMKNASPSAGNNLARPDGVNSIDG
jgi:hypothetical protein